MRRTRTTAIVILAGVMGLTMISLAQQNDQYKPGTDAWALQFSIGSNFQLGSFQGALLSIKKHTSPDCAWRLGIGTNGEFESTEQTQWQGLADTIYSTDNVDTDNGGAVIAFQYMRYLTLDSDIKPYLAGGPQIGYTKTSQTRIPDRYSATHSKTEASTVSGGVSVSLGAEWFFAQSMSLSAEYGLYMGYSHSESKFNSSSVDADNNYRSESSSDAFIIDDLGARLGLSVYF